MTKVVHIRKGKYDVYIGRPSKWGNPYSHKPSAIAGTVIVASREVAIERFERMVRADPDLVAQIKQELKGKTLGCWCKPLACHGDVLAKIAEEA